VYVEDNNGNKYYLRVNVIIRQVTLECQEVYDNVSQTTLNIILIMILILSLQASPLLKREFKYDLLGIPESIIS